MSEMRPSEETKRCDAVHFARDKLEIPVVFWETLHFLNLISPL